MILFKLILSLIINLAILSIPINSFSNTIGLLAGSCKQFTEGTLRPHMFYCTGFLEGFRSAVYQIDILESSKIVAENKNYTHVPLTSKNQPVQLFTTAEKNMCGKEGCTLFQEMKFFDLWYKDRLTNLKNELQQQKFRETPISIGYILFLKDMATLK